MPERTSPPFRADHVGSLLRPLRVEDQRCGGFEPLRFVPKGKMLVLGLVTTRRGELETEDELKRRIEEASAHSPVEKLRLVVETAQEAWC